MKEVESAVMAKKVADKLSKWAKHEDNETEAEERSETPKHQKKEANSRVDLARLAEKLAKRSQKDKKMKK